MLQLPIMKSPSRCRRFSLLCFLGAASFLLVAASGLRASGMYNPIFLLEDPEYAAIKSPEFWFELEMKDLARQYEVKEEFVDGRDVAAAELASFDEAMKDPAVKLADAGAIRAALVEKRKLIYAPPPPTEEAADPAPEPAAAAPVEVDDSPLPKDQFSLYQRGAAAYQQHDFAGARKAWETLLALPEAERHYRNVWAAFMLGRLDIREDALEHAAAQFQKCRAFAAAGDNDAPGLAAVSYGWEAMTISDQTPGKALELYLKQLATGDTQGFTSLRMVMRTLYSHSDYATVEEKLQAKQPDWKSFANDSLLRQVITRYFLAAEQDLTTRSDGPDPDPEDSLSLWLQAMEDRGKPKAEEADRLAWLAYRSAKYDQAKRWLKLAPPETRLSLWLTAKLALRDGHLDQAAAALEKAQSLFGAPERLEVTNADYTPLPKASVRADQAVVLLGQGKFIDALTAFIEAGFWPDAAYVAERVLTLQELHDYVDQHHPKQPRRDESSVDVETIRRVVPLPKVADTPDVPDKDAEPDWDPNQDMMNILQFAINTGNIDPTQPQAQAAIAWRLRWVLAKRMVREDQEAAAAPYFPANVQPLLAAYLQALKKAGDKSASATERARGWWQAAWIARHGGMELMDTDAEPDNAIEGGSFAIRSILAQRRTGLAPENEEFRDSNEDATTPIKLTKKIKFGVAPSEKEKARLAKNILPHDYRGHHRWIAAALARKAAALLKDGTEEKADVLNEAGSWLFSRDVKGEESFFFDIKRTCPDTKIGKQVLEKTHTFPLGGPWSGPLPPEDPSQP